MTHTITHVEEWEEEICDNCNHPVSMHYDVPEEVIYSGTGNKISYIAEGCMALAGTRKLKGDNAYLRCDCLHSV